MAGKKGGGTLATQIQKLRAGLTSEEIDRAENLAEKEPLIMALAFKLLPKTHSSEELTKREQEFYEEMKVYSGEAAVNRWREIRIKQKKVHKKP